MTLVEWAYLNRIQKVLNVLTGCFYVSPQGISNSLPWSSNILEAATKLEKDVDGLNKDASITRNTLKEEKNKAKAQITQAKDVRMSAYIKLLRTLFEILYTLEIHAKFSFLLCQIRLS